MKLGQLLSTRADLLPPVYLEELSRLQDHVEPFDYLEVVPIVEANWACACPTPSRRSKPSRSPPHRWPRCTRRRCATGGRGRQGQRPDIAERITTDLEAIAEIATFADKHRETGRRFGFEGMAAEFRHAMMQELDFEREARSLATLADNLEEFDQLVVPRPIPDYTTARVLTMTYVDGRKVTSLNPAVLVEADGDALVSQLFAAYLKQILVDGFFHADPHPGNILLTTDRRLALVDLGMTARVDPAMQDRLLKLMLAIGDGDGEKAAEAGRELGDRREGVEFDERLFRRRVSDLVNEQRGADLGQTSAGAVIAQLSRLAGECGCVRLPSSPWWARPAQPRRVARTLAPQVRPRNSSAIRSPTSCAGACCTASPRSVFARDGRKEFAEQLPARVNR